MIYSAPPKKTTVTIIPAYNASKGDFLKYIFLNIELLLSNRESDYIYIIDNNSEDDTDSKLTEFINKCRYKEKIIYKLSSSNLGSAGGFFEGVDYALKRNFDYVFLLDQDGFVNSDTLTILKNQAFILKDNFSFLSSAVYDTNNSSNYLEYFRVKFNKTFGYFYPAISSNLATKSSELLIKIDAGGNCGLLINLKNKMNFNSKLFMHFDDYEFCLRLANCHPGYLVLNSKVFHPNKAAQNSLNEYLKDKFLRYFIFFPTRTDQSNYIIARNYIFLLKLNMNRILFFFKAINTLFLCLVFKRRFSLKSTFNILRHLDLLFIK